MLQVLRSVNKEQHITQIIHKYLFGDTLESYAWLQQDLPRIYLGFSWPALIITLTIVITLLPHKLRAITLDRGKKKNQGRDRLIVTQT